MTRPYYEQDGITIYHADLPGHTADAGGGQRMRELIAKAKALEAAESGKDAEVPSMDVD